MHWKWGGHYASIETMLSSLNSVTNVQGISLHWSSTENVGKNPEGSFNVRPNQKSEVAITLHLQ